MTPFTTHEGIAAVLNRTNVDTDQIIPKQFLKRTERTGFGRFLFYDWRFLADGKTPNPDFELNAQRYEGATVLVAGANFGCGSSREHAPWSLLDYGFRVVIAPSFADIFYSNCFKNGMLPIRLSDADVGEIQGSILSTPGARVSVSLPEETVTSPDGRKYRFRVDPFRKDCLIKGLDEIGWTLQFDATISAAESRLPPAPVLRD